MSGFRSSVYECRVMHHRLSPKEHRFCHTIFMLWLDLDELDALDARLPGFGRNRFNAYGFYDRDHLSQSGESTKCNIQTWMRRRGVDAREDDRIMLLTFPRVLGYVFNPVSFYFCFRKTGEAICAVVEVGNTFREMKRFLLPGPPVGQDGLFELTAPKHFYVSPFFDLDVKFNFRLRIPDDRLALFVDDYDGADQVLRTRLTGRRFELTGARLGWFSIKYPLITLKVILLIHWHALLLYWKKVPFFRKAAQPERQRDVMRPHES